MFTVIRQSTRQLRLWFIAAAAVLALTSVLEAGHAHGVFTQADDQCALCQHSVSLDKLLGSPALILIPLLVAATLSTSITRFVPRLKSRLALIRAPPALLRTR
ncbi:hypothetical protein [Cellvibrio zantedeschiae]|uniref:hypothetical protein n=1 Tax=Cellvibrio zantedeschiae TaxID=1237077 RepID=UPI00167B2E88|nr:hypothetical protein [Cellvibrio zantedeschiae]